MPRVAKKKKPLRGSVRQNTTAASAEVLSAPWFGFGARLALLILMTIAVIVFSAWLWRSEWPHRQAARIVATAVKITQKTGFAVDDVVVDGRHYTDKDALLTALGVSAGSPIFLFDPQEAYARILALPWTESATVLRSLPGKIIVELVERQPMARWQHDGKTSVIDREGKELGDAKPENFPNLPLVVGNAAPEQTKELLTELRGVPTVAQVLKAAVRVGERRWNLYIQPNVLIRMPERDLPVALTKLAQLLHDQKITDRNVVAIDLRLPDRLVIEPGTPPASPQYGDSRE